MSDVELALALDTPTLLKLLRIAPSKLNYWVGRGFCHRTLDTGSGRRATRYWTVEELVILRSIKALREAGCSLQLIARAEDRLRSSFNAGLANAILYYDGRDIFVDDQGTIISLVQQAGQATFTEALRIAAFPLRPWVEEGERSAELVDIAAIRNRRELIRAKRSTA